MEMQLVVRAINRCESGNRFAWNDQARCVETALWPHPGNGHQVRGRRGREARAVDEDRATGVRLRELSRLDLDPDRRPCRQASDQDLVGLIVGKWPKQTAILEEGQSPLYLLLTPGADHAVFIQNGLSR